MKITDGPFADFHGIIDMIDREQRKVTVRVSMFGREERITFDLPDVERMR